MTQNEKIVACLAEHGEMTAVEISNRLGRNPKTYPGQVCKARDYGLIIVVRQIEPRRKGGIPTNVFALAPPAPAFIRPDTRNTGASLSA